MVPEAEPEQSPLDAVVPDQSITVWANSGADAETFDKDGRLVPCGHQRPAEGRR
ncbi:hypothetical protein [Streptomyces sp. cmx-18-6]|uniref:hypothetical protein n=1 Tax=Streptomyces sp. cmx-18-6 TaxID=2790930 RepID=UPI0039811C4F